MKKLISKVLVFTMLFSLMPVGILAADTVEIGDFTYSITEEGAVLTQYNQNAQGEVTIPETITHEEEDYSVIGIGERAFRAKALTRITIPETVVSIENNAFQNCRNLDQVVIPDSITSIGNFAFGGTWGLRSIVLSEKLTSISTSMFNGSTGLKTIVIPESVTSIGMNAFTGCTALESIVLPESLTSIGTNAFFNCSSLTDIKIPEGVTSIGTGTFQGCSSLNKVILEKDMSYIHVQAFTGAISLKEIEVVNENDTYSSIDGVLYNKEKDTIIKYPQAREETSFEIPQQVISIHSYAFQDSVHLTGVDIPENVTTIGANAFNGCSNLTEITLPKNITSIENYLFAGCTSLSSIEIPQGVTSIGNYAFNGNTSLSTVRLPDTLVSIGSDAFRGNSSLKGIDFRDGLETIGNNAFINSTGLEKIDIPESVISIGNTAFRNAAALKEIIIRNKETTIGNNAFVDIPNLTIGGIKGSTAEEYARNNFISFKEIFTGSLTIQGGTGEYAPTLDTIIITADNQLEPADGEITLYYAEDQEGTKTVEEIIGENRQIEKDNGKYIIENLSSNTQYAFVAISIKDGFFNEMSGILRVTTANPVTLLIEDIDALPSLEEVILADEPVIIGLLERYNELDSSQKSQVSNYSDLEKAKEKIDIIKADRAAADQVVDLINELPETITLENREQIAAIRVKYNNDLTPEQRALVTNMEVLEQAEDIIEGLEKEIKDAEDRIADLPEEIKFSHKAMVTEAKTLYDELAEDQKTYIKNRETLMAAIGAIERLESEIAEVQSKIEALPVRVTLPDQEQVAEARALYEELTEEQKDYIGNINVLKAAEAKIAELIGYEAEAQPVVEQIQSLPKAEDIRLEDEEAIGAAYDAYMGLSEGAKEFVHNKDKLDGAQMKLNSLKKDDQAADEVRELINALPETITYDNIHLVEEAGEKYENLTPGQKELIGEEMTDKLKGAEKAADRLKANRKAADQVIDQINAIPERVSLEDEGKIRDARETYDGLKAEQKALVGNEDKLKGAEEKLNELKADKAAADAVIEEINRLPEEITLEDKEQIEKARKAYDDLSEEQRALVSNEDKLKEAENRIKQLGEDIAAADKVIDQINALPEKITLSDKEKVEAALAAYNELTEEQKELVENADKLMAAKEEIARLEDKDPGKDPGDSGKDLGKDPGGDSGGDSGKGSGKDKELGKGSDKPKTGDEFSPIHWMSILGLSVAGIFVIRKKRKAV